MYVCVYVYLYITYSASILSINELDLYFNFFLCAFELYVISLIGYYID